MNNNNSFSILLSIPLLLLLGGCKKLVAIDPPIASITTTEVFSTDAQATSAMAGVYTSMLNGTTNQANSALNSFASGLSTIVGAYSSDELGIFSGSTVFNTNKLTPITAFYSSTMWTSAYKAIYNSNAVIEGIAASTSGNIHDSIKVELTAEAKFTRAFSYCYLVSNFGGVPMVLTIDFNKTQGLPRSSQQDVYKQIIQDLKDAQAALPEDYRYGANGERIVPNKWAATALLARVYLYTGDYANAATQATAVINNTAQFGLVTDLNSVFLRNSKEAIWQMQQYTSFVAMYTATPEGFQMIAQPLPHSSNPTVVMMPSLLNSFEAGDKRRVAWVDSTKVTLGNIGTYYYPLKYKVGYSNRGTTLGAVPSEYYMVLRLAEQYLIRAEAEMNGANGGASAAIADLNVIRNRAGLAPLPGTLNAAQLLAAVAHERQDELFCEWGHRWYDLRRMGLAHDVLSNIDYKQPWAGDYQFLYPIPPTEIVDDHFLTQNDGYN
jgi:hypothetical protein